MQISSMTNVLQASIITLIYYVAVVNKIAQNN